MLKLVIEKVLIKLRAISEIILHILNRRLLDQSNGINLLEKFVSTFLEKSSNPILQQKAFRLIFIMERYGM